MGWMATENLSIYGKMHLDTAKLLLMGVCDSVDEIWKETRSGEKYVLVSPEHSRTSIIRRCIQIRQELLIVMRELEKQ